MEEAKVKSIILVEKFLICPPTTTNDLFLELCLCIEEFTNQVVSLKNLMISQKKLVVSLTFYFNQIISSLEFLVTIIQKEKEMDSMLSECRMVACNRIKFCLDRIEECFTDKKTININFGLFLRWMDNALIQVARINIDKRNFVSTMEETKKFYEDILTHAMSIAQVCLDGDRNIIRGSCGSVYEVINGLERELNKEQPNKAMVSLFIEDASNKLCALERKVDIAILKLSLYVFSKYYKTLNQLHACCLNNYKTPFGDKEADNIISDFDLHTDRIFQIGLFAVYCSSNVKSGTKIQHQLATLEFLEPELVPALKMLLKNNSALTTASASIYKDYWISEANKLKTLVFEIIDPSAFCKVIYDEITSEIHRIMDKRNENKEFCKSDFISIFEYGKVLIEFLLIVVRVEDISDDQLKDKIRKCNSIALELNAGIDILDGNDMVNHERLLKRSIILQSQVKKVLLCLNIIDKRKGGSFREQIDENTVDENHVLVEQNSFSKILIRSREILENRSILYRTPKKSCRSQLYYSGQHPAESLNDGEYISKMHFSFRPSDEKSPSMQENVECIFQNLSCLKSYFSEEDC